MPRSSSRGGERVPPGSRRSPPAEGAGDGCRRPVAAAVPPGSRRSPPAEGAGDGSGRPVAVAVPPGSRRSPPAEGAGDGCGRPVAAAVPPGSRRSVAAAVPAGARRPSPPAALSPAAVEHLLGYLLALAEVPTSRAFRQHVGGPFGLRPVEFTLLMLLQANRRASATQIRDALRMPAPHVTTLVNRLAQRGLVQRGRDPHDGRAVRITLSAAGTLLAARLQAVAQHMEDGLHSALTPAERNQLRRLLKKLANAGAAG